jgi:pyruvate dehydrogenase E2 component (dihydrolipoamide acetyltransferase)
MPFEITMPQLGLTMEKGTIVEWLVAAGDAVAPGQEILQVETDKAIVTVEAHYEGTIERILVQAGQEVPVGRVLAVGLAPGETPAAGLPAAGLPAAGLPAADWQPSGQASTGTVPTAAGAEQKAPTPPAPAQKEGRQQASWKARRLAREAGLDLAAVAGGRIASGRIASGRNAGGVITGSGPGGRVVAADVSRAQAARNAVQTTSAPGAAAPGGAIKATPVAANLAARLGLDLAAIASGRIGSGPQGQITQSDVLAAAAAIIRRKAPAAVEPDKILPQVASTTPLQGVRKIVSQGMASSARSTARVTLFREVVVSELIALRDRFRAQGVNASYNDLLVRICAEALSEHPEANARLGEGQIEHLDRVNIGLAVDTERGLLVPVIHNADKLTIPHIATESAWQIEAARTGRSLPNDLTGGTFTITNLGMLGIEGFTPVINLPECCILGVGRIVRKPVASDVDDTVVVRPVMTLSLAFDHRALDGAAAARFLDRIVQLVQDPMLLFSSG